MSKNDRNEDGSEDGGGPVGPKPDAHDPGRGFAFLLELSRLLSRKDLEKDEVLARVAELVPSGLARPESVMVRISVNGCVYGTPDLKGAADLVRSPLMVSGHCAGSLDAVCSGGFSFEEKGILAETALRVSGFVERWVERAARQRGLAANDLLTDFFSCLLNPSPIGELTLKALEMSKILTDSPKGFVGFLDPETGYMVCPTMRPAKRPPGEAPGDYMVFKKFSGLWGFVLKNRQPLKENSPEKHPGSEGVPSGHISIKRFLGVPAVIDGNTVGMIALVNKPTDYTDSDLLVISRVADLLALAISRVRMVDALNRSNALLEMRVKERTRRLTEEMAARGRAEDDLRRSKEMFQAVFDGISDPLLMLGSDRKVLMLNRAAVEYYRLVYPERSLGKACFRSLAREQCPCPDCGVLPAVDQGLAVTVERRGFRDPARHEQVTVYPVRNFATASSASIVHVRDITESKAVQRHLVQSEKMASLGYLISGIAHEINNPNNFITFNIPILKEYVQSVLPVLDEYAAKADGFTACGMAYGEFREDLFKILDNIEYGSYRINKIVSNLRAFSRKREQAEPKWVKVGEVVENVLAICRIKLSRSVKTLQVSVPEDLPMLKTDPDMLAQIIINFIVNAGQAADKGDSWVSLAVRLDDKDQGMVVIEVADNGCGMDEATKERIFDPFFTTRRAGEGTGLGLSMSHYLAATLGGRIEVDSKPGEGSSFRLFFHL